MSAKRPHKSSREDQVEEGSPKAPPTDFRAVTYIRMQLADLEFLALRKLMTDPRTFEQVKKIFATATTEVTGVKMMSLRPCGGSHDCEPDEHCMRGECVFGPPRR
jgi:hypothetical protein